MRVDRVYADIEHGRDLLGHLTLTDKSYDFDFSRRQFCDLLFLTKCLTDYDIQYFRAIVFFIIGLLVADFVRGIVLTTCQSLSIPSAKVISSVVFYFLFLTVTMSALDQAKISTDLINSSFMIIIAGVVASFALGYGLASKDMMSNFLASFYVKNKFEAGDRITIDGIQGQIETMDNKSFVLKTSDSKIVFPLNKLAQDKVEIHS